MYPGLYNRSYHCESDSISELVFKLNLYYRDLYLESELHASRPLPIFDLKIHARSQRSSR